MKIIDGNLVEVFDNGDIDVMAHCANAWNTMGAGVAKAIIDKWPEAYEVDKQTKRGDLNKLGTFTQVDVMRNCNKIGRIYNLYGQFNFGGGNKCYLNYDAISLSLYKLNALEKGKKIGLPFLLGCGLAGGDWIIVESIIERQLKNCDVILVKYDGPEIQKRDYSKDKLAVK